MRKTNVTATWIVKPASRIFFPVFGSFALLSEEPISAAPVICTTVVTASLVIKIQSTAFGDRIEYSEPVREMRTERMA